MTGAVKKTQKTRSMEKDAVTTKASSPYQHELKNTGSTPNIHWWWRCESLHDSQFTDHCKTETWGIIYCPWQKDLREFSHPSYEWYIKLGVRRHLLLGMDQLSLCVIFARDSGPDEPLVSWIISQWAIVFLYLPTRAHFAKKSNLWECLSPQKCTSALPEQDGFLGQHSCLPWLQH